jgi:hypothetical protein
MNLIQHIQLDPQGEGIVGEAHSFRKGGSSLTDSRSVFSCWATWARASTCVVSVQVLSCEDSHWHRHTTYLRCSVKGTSFKVQSCVHFCLRCVSIARSSAARTHWHTSIQRSSRCSVRLPHSSFSSCRRSQTVARDAKRLTQMIFQATKRLCAVWSHGRSWPSALPLAC